MTQSKVITTTRNLRMTTNGLARRRNNSVKWTVAVSIAICLVATSGALGDSSASSSSSSGVSLSSPVPKTPTVAETNSKVAEQQQQASSSSSSAEEEYVQIKPEEAADLAKSLGELGLPVGGVSDASGSAEHKSADDELSAHLAKEDVIGQMESQPQPMMGAGRHSRSLPRPYAPAQQQPGANYPRQQPQTPPAAAPHQPQQPYQRARPMAYMKDKLASAYTGSGSGHQNYQSQQQYSSRPTRQLPRGAAAGYAAFREFVRAQANKYRQPQMPTSGVASGYPQPPQSYQSPMSQPRPPRHEPVAPVAARRPLPASSKHPERATGTNYNQGSKAKVGVAQAYIPHLQQVAGEPARGTGYQQAASSGANYQPDQMLTRLYGGHAPQGVGKPEYSKDYGMVIHYPQATVYTEPMSVDQLHKLAGSGISQVLEQLQHGIAYGPRDESNMLRASKRPHHLGQGVHIHAKEYYAPGKGGAYVPTTAAVISTSAQQAGESYAASGYGSSSSSNGYSSAGASSQADKGLYGAHAAASGGQALGSGYERVRAAVAASQAATSGGSYKHQEQDLEGLYKADAAFGMELQQPEVQSQLNAYAKSAASKRPLSYSEHNGPMHLAPRRPTNRYPARRPSRHQHPSRPQQHQNQQSNNYNQAMEEALQHQMQQLIQEIQHGDEQYGGKSRPVQPASQGYPHKLIQKYQQQQQQRPQSYQNSPFDQHEGLEIPHGPSDQIGEIADLIETLRGSLEGAAKQEQPYSQMPAKQTPTSGYQQQQQQQQPQPQQEIGMISSALGQTPSYSVQVPVANGDANQPLPVVQQQPQYQMVPAVHQTHQSQLPYVAPPAPQMTEYQPGPAELSYQSPAASGRNQDAYSNGQQQQQQQQQQIQISGQADYQPAPEVQSAVQSYGMSQEQVEVNSYQQQHPQPQLPQAVSGIYPAPSAAAEQQPASGYASSPEQHSQIINHLVPTSPIVVSSVASPQVAGAGYQEIQQAPATSGYSTQNDQQQQHQPIQQEPQPIHLGAPTEAQYQQAHSLSSFVDSLPTDYQELLRHPAPAMLSETTSTGTSESTGYSNTQQLHAAGSSSSASVVPSPGSMSSAESQNTGSEHSKAKIAEPLQSASHLSHLHSRHQSTRLSSLSSSPNQSSSSSGSSSPGASSSSSPSANSSGSSASSLQSLTSSSSSSKRLSEKSGESASVASK